MALKERDVQFVKVYNGGKCRQGLYRVGECVIEPGHTVLVRVEDAQVIRDNPKDYSWAIVKDDVPKPEATDEEAKNAGRAGQVEQGTQEAAQPDQGTEEVGVGSDSAENADTIDYGSVLAKPIQVIRPALDVFTIHQLEQLEERETQGRNRKILLRWLEGEIGDRKREQAK